MLCKVGRGLKSYRVFVLAPVVMRSEIFAMCRLYGKLGCLYKPVKVTDSYKVCPFAGHHESVIFYGKNDWYLRLTFKSKIRVSRNFFE